MMGGLVGDLLLLGFRGLGFRVQGLGFGVYCLRDAPCELNSRGPL